MPFDFIGGAQALDDPAGEPAALFRPAQICPDDCELVPAKPRNEVLLAERNRSISQRRHSASLSPIEWPSVSLTPLNPSRSRHRTETAYHFVNGAGSCPVPRGRRPGWASPSGWSCRARWAMWASAFWRSVMSSWNCHPSAVGGTLMRGWWRSGRPSDIDLMNRKLPLAGNVLAAANVSSVRARQTSHC